MIRVIIEVYYYSPDRQKNDLEVPAEIPLGTLYEMLIEALNLPSRQDFGWVLKDLHRDTILYPSPVGRYPHLTLLELGLLDGSTLILESQNQFQPVVNTPRAQLISESGRQYPLSEDRVIIGRAFSAMSTADPYIDLGDEPMGDTVSRYHAMMRWMEGRYYLQLLSQASNPITVNGSPLFPTTPVRLNNQDHIQIGGVRLIYSQE